MDLDDQVKNIYIMPSKFESNLGITILEIDFRTSLGNDPGWSSYKYLHYAMKI